MHLYAGMSECDQSYIALDVAIVYSFSVHSGDLAILFHYRNATDLMFIPVPSNAQNFTGVVDGFRSVSLPSQFRFGTLSYSTAYVCK